MALQKKYYYTFKDINNIQYTTEIWQDTAAVITAEEIRGDCNPFIIEYPTANIFEPVKGSGCELNLLSTTDRKFFNLYTADMMEYQIRFYKSGVLIWCGYLDSELYNEPFNELSNYPVTFTGSDGFALLERLNYLASDGSNYTGLMLQWDIIKNILNKLVLPYKNIYVGLSTISNDFTLASGETLFHKTYSNNQNWYNEDGEAETTRTVLENILKSYGAFIIQDNANIYITDINTVAGATTASFKKYDSSFNYVSTDSINLNLGDLSTIKFAASNQQMNVVSGFNKQIITYSPYIDSKIIDYNAEEDFSSPITSIIRGSSPYRWEETTYLNSNSWNKSYGVFASYEGIDEAVKGESDSYLKIGNIAGNLSFRYKKELPILLPANSKLKISCKAFARTIDDLFNKSNVVETKDIYQITIKCKLKIDNRQYLNFQNFEESQDYNGVFSYSWKYYSFWVDATDTRTLDLNFQNVSSTLDKSYNPLDNKWTDLKYTYDLELKEPTDFYIPLDSGFSGAALTFEIYDWEIRNGADIKQANYSASHAASKSNVKDIRLKDLKFTIVDAKGNEYSDSDIEYIGFMNRKFKNEGDEITIYQGTSKIDNPIEKAALMGYNTNYFYLKNWTREGKTDCIENLLLRSVVSNYTNKRIELSATINQLNSILGCVKYDSFLAGKNLMIVGSTQNFADAATDVTLQEVIKDNLEINKSW